MLYGGGKVDYSKTTDYTKKEKEFINSPLYQVYNQTFEDENKAVEKNKKNWINKRAKKFTYTYDEKNRLKLKKNQNPTLNKNEKKVMDNASFTLLKDYKNREYPTMAFDSYFYEIFNGYGDYGFLNTEFVECKLDFKLSYLGCRYEPDDYSRWGIICDKSKMQKPIKDFETEYKNKYPFCEKYDLS